MDHPKPTRAPRHTSAWTVAKWPCWQACSMAQSCLLWLEQRQMGCMPRTRTRSDPGTGSSTVLGLCTTTCENCIETTSDGLG